jgi:hypothetical protein
VGDDKYTSLLYLSVNDYRQEFYCAGQEISACQDETKKNIGEEEELYVSHFNTERERGGGETYKGRYKGREIETRQKERGEREARQTKKGERERES